MRASALSRCAAIASQIEDANRDATPDALRDDATLIVLAPTAPTTLGP